MRVHRARAPAYRRWIWEDDWARIEAVPRLQRKLRRELRRLSAAYAARYHGQRVPETRINRGSYPTSITVVWFAEVSSVWLCVTRWHVRWDVVNFVDREIQVTRTRNGRPPEALDVLRDCALVAPEQKSPYFRPWT